MADRGKHKVVCNKIKRTRNFFRFEEDELRATAGDKFTQPNDVFETSIGHFWDIDGTRDYMTARYALVKAILEVKTLDAVKSALDHAMGMLRLHRSDDLGVRSLIPSLLLRLDRDQDCYRFVKWWVTVGQALNYGCGDMSLPFISVRRANAFERVDYMCGDVSYLGHVVAVTLLKIRLLLSLTALKNKSIVLSDFQAPAEIFQNITLRLPDSTIVTNNQEILNRTDHTPQIEQLAWQVRKLYQTVRKANKHFWPGLLNPERHLEASPLAISHGSVAEMQLILQHSIDAWMETPGALEVIKGPISG